MLDNLELLYYSNMFAVLNFNNGIHTQETLVILTSWVTTKKGIKQCMRVSPEEKIQNPNNSI